MTSLRFFELTMEDCSFSERGTRNVRYCAHEHKARRRREGAVRRERGGARHNTVFCSENLCEAVQLIPRVPFGVRRASRLNPDFEVPVAKMSGGKPVMPESWLDDDNDDDEFL